MKNLIDIFNNKIYIIRGKNNYNKHNCHLS